MAQRRVDQRRGPARELSARGVALAALARVDEGAYANLVTAEVLGSSGLDQRDRAFVTDLVHGTVRMQGALDWAWGRFVRTPPDPAVRRALRLGAYQLLIQGTAPHAAVAETVAETPAWARGFVNAVLRKVAADPRPAWPDLPTELSYPDWIVALLVRDLGEGDALAALRHMNQPPGVSVRDDGYRQDLASQWVAEAVEAGAGEVVLDLCAAPGGKATVMASGGAMVVAADVRPHRTALIARNVSDLGFGSSVQVVVADGRHAPFRAGAFDRVLLDVPCSGLGVLHRRPDARWRITAADVDELVTLQRELIGAAISLCRPGGIIVLSACTLTAAESLGHDRWLASSHPGLIAIGPPGPPWRPLGRGARLLPQDAGTDGMALFRYRRQ